MRKIVAILLVPLFIGCFWVMWIAFQPPRGRPEISIGLVGYTKSASGEQLAIFSVTNLSHSDIYIRGGWTLLKSQTNTDGWVRVKEPFWIRMVLARGAITNFTIPPPTNQITWKYAFDARNDIGLEQDIWYALNRRALKPKDYVIESQWVDSTR